MKNLNSLLLLIVLFTISNLQAQITGTLTVPSGTYPNLAAAFTALNTQGVGAGGAIINITAPQTCPLNGFQLGSLILNNSLSSANQLTINGNGNIITAYAGTRAGSQTSGINDGMIILSGTDYININNLVFNELATNTSALLAMEHAIGMYNRTSTVGSADGCRFITITGCTFNLSNSASAGATIAAVQYVWDSATAVAWDAASQVDIHRSITVNNNTFATIYNGINFRGASSRNGRALIVTNNTFTGIGGGASTAFAVQTIQLDSLVYNNNVSTGDIAQTTTSYHLFASTGSGALQEVKNNDLTLTSGTTTSTTNAIQLSSIGAGREVSGNRIRFGSFPAITSAPITGIGLTYSGGNNNWTQEIFNNVFMDEVIPGTTGTVNLINSAASTGIGRINLVRNNTISNITKTNSGILNCINAGTSENTIVRDNTINNVTITNNSVSGTTTLRAIECFGSPTQQNIHGNTISNFTVTGSSTSTASIVSGIRSGTTGTNVANIFQNDINNLTIGTGTLSGTVTGIELSINTNNVYKNKIRNLTANQATGLVRGILVSTGITINIYNNFISNLSTPSANSDIAVSGIHGTSTTTGAITNISYNTIFVSSTAPLTSTGALFGAAGICMPNSAIPTYNIRNNIVNITGTANGAGYISAIKRQIVGTAGTKPTQINASNNIYNAPYIFGEGLALATATNVYYVTGGTAGTADANFNTSCGLYKTFMGETGTFSENNLTSLGAGLFAPSGASFAQNNATTSTIPTISDDYSSIARGTFPDVGALEFVGPVLDASGPIINYTPLTNSICTNAVSLMANITDANGVNSAAGAKPRLYFKRSTNSNILAPSNTSLSNGWKFVEATNNTSPYVFNIDFSIIFGGTVSSGQTIDYFVVAQDLNTVPNVGTNQAIYPSGFCPSSVALSTAAFPVSGFRSFDIATLPTNITSISSRSTLCLSGDITLSLGGDPSPGAQYQWQSSPAGANNFTNISGATSSTYNAVGVSSSTDYRCIVTCGGTPIAASPSTAVNVTVTSPQILSTTPATSCTPGPISLTLSATANSGSTINWYNMPMGGLPLASGGTFNTPLITSTTTYYAAASQGSSTENVGKPTYTATDNTSGNAWGLVFDVITQPIVINTVDVYSVGTGGSITVELRDNTGALVTTVGPFTYPAGSTATPVLVTLPLNLPVSVGTGWRIQSASMTGALIRNVSGNTYPYTSPSGNVSITSGFITNPGSATYYWFFNWVVSSGCESARVPVTASIITTNPTCPANQTVCLSAPAFTLTGATPTGGVYSGPGVVGGQFSPAIAGLGTHTITYTICGLTCTFTITVTQATPTIQISENSGATPNDGLICTGASATLTASASNTYIWSNGATTQSITVNAVGTYTVTVTNAIGCTGSTSASISISPPPASSFSVTQPTTCATTNGAIDLTISTAGTYTYLWSNGATTQDLTGVAVGDFVVTVTDQFGCTHVLMQSLIGPGGCNVCPTLPSTLITTSACTNNTFNITANGLANLGVTYGVTFKSFGAATTNPYVGGTILANVANTSLTNNGTTATASANIATAGTNFIYAILNPAPPDPSCRPSSTATLVVNAPPTAGINVTETSGTLTNDGIICQGASATLTATGGGSYLWSTNATTTAISVNTAGTYTVTVTSTSGCTGTASRIITVNPVTTPVIAITESSGTTPNDGNICQGASATLTCISMGTYAWSTGATTSSIIVNASGTYTVTLTNSNGCTASISSTITVNPLPTALISVTESSGTPNDGIIIEGSNATLTASGGVTYRWNTNATTPAITVSPLVNTTYTVTVTNANGCTSTASRMITVVPPPCSIVCAGNQNINLPAGGCEYILPNFVTFVDMCDIYTIVQVAGPATGSRVAPGTYTLRFELRRKNNGLVVDDCELTLNVAGFANPVGTLTCNDHVNISVDQNCRVTLSADMFLEGGPYACYWDYQINIWPNNSQANAINNVPQGVGLNLPFGDHTYEIVGSDGNKCWGTFTVEDKLPPVVNCNCVDNPVIVPITNITGSFDLNSPKLEVSTIAAACTKTTTANRQMPYAVIIPFNVSTAGSITFTINATLNTNFPFSLNSNFGYQYIYSDEPNLQDVCDNYVIASGFTTNGTFTPTAAQLAPIGGQFIPGVTYYYVFASAYIQNIMNYSITFTHNNGGQVLSIQNPADAKECQFKCYDLDVVKAETIVQLLGTSPNRSKLTTPPSFSDCGGVTPKFEDRVVPSDCGATKLIRDWTFTDAEGNATTCSQTFTFNKIRISELTPPAQEVVLTCGMDASPENIAAFFDVDSRTPNTGVTNIGPFNDDWSQTPAVVELNEGYKFGYFTYQLPGFNIVPATAPNLHDQKVDRDICGIYTSYSDDVFPACGNGCGGNMKIIRTWKVLDWCTKEVSEYFQVIKAVDQKAPTFDVKDVTVSVSPWECTATYNVERPWELQDNCSKPEEIKWGVKVEPGFEVNGNQPNYTISGLTKGNHTITYWAQDCCGNYTEIDATISVLDASAPVAVAKQNIVVSLSGSGTAADGAAKLYGWQIDNGSYDQCTDIKFEVRRTAGGACGNVGANNHNNNSTYNHSPVDNVPNNVWAHPQDTRDNNITIDTDGGEFVKFCCEDIPAGAEFGLHEVELRVWDDGNMNGVYGDNEIINGMKDNYNTTWVTVRVENKLPPVLVCPANVTVTCDMELNLSIGTDTPVGSVDLTMTGAPKAYDLCSNLDITYTDQWVGQFNDVCKTGTLRRTFKVKKGSVEVTCIQLITVTTITAPFTVTFPQNNTTTEWGKCNFELSDARDANNPVIKKPIVNYGQCDIVGENIKIDTFSFEDGACKKWRVEYNYKNWCTGQDLGPFVHFYTYKDEIAPILTCQDQMFAANPSALNPNGGCEAQVALEASASDALVCADESWIKWQMFFDGWANGTVDRLASSFVNKSWNGIWVAQTRLLATGAPNPVWAQLQQQHPGAPLADLVYVTYIRPTKASGETVKIPVGTGATAFILDAENINHKVLWKVTDGCGNVDQCESTVMVVDKKAPTPYCISISTALMQGNPAMVELWAKDFDKGAFDNCTPQSKLYFTFDGVAPIYSRINEAHFYKAGAAGAPSVNATAAEYAQGRAYRWLPSMGSAGFVWTTSGTYNVKVSVWDEAWNTDYCQVELRIKTQEEGSDIIAGNVSTYQGNPLSGVTVSIDGNLPEFPKTTLTDQNGDYSMLCPEGIAYDVQASFDGDYLNGVSTLDLVFIQRHILGIQLLDSEYKVIAADANNNGTITASDLSELRKLILGVTSELPNASWRFPVTGTTVQTSPISFTESLNLANLSADMSNQNFVAVKIGDVNGSVATNANSGVVEARSNHTVAMTIAEASIAAGEVVEIPVTAANFADVAGFQYTMNLKGASFVGINSGAIEMNANNVGVLANGTVTMSYATSEAVNANEGDVLFTLVVRANQAMNVSEMITLNSAVTKAESYNSDLKVGSVSLNVRTAPVSGIELFQNEPNPFRGQTTVSFTMPEAGAATLSVYDMTGKLVVVRNIDAAKGLNSEIFTKEQLGVSGVMYYTLESGDFTATKKMIIVE